MKRLFTLGLTLLLGITLSHAQKSTGYHTADTSETTTVTLTRVLQSTLYFSWNDEEDATVSDNDHADLILTLDLLSLISNGSSPWLELNDFDFNVPANAIVTGVTVSVENARSGLLNLSVLSTQKLELMNGGTTLGSTKSGGNLLTLGLLSGGTSVNEIGGPSDSWGASLTPEMVNSSNFGVRFGLDFGLLGLSLGNLHIDEIKVQVHYIEPNMGGLFPEVWLKADQDVYADTGVTLASNSTTVQQWINQQANTVGDAIQSIGSYRPTYLTDGLNFNPTVSFDPSNDNFLELMDNDSIDLNTMTIFAVVDPETTANVGGIVGKRPSTPSGNGFEMILDPITGLLQMIVNPDPSTTTSSSNQTNLTVAAEPKLVRAFFDNSTLMTGDQGTDNSVSYSTSTADNNNDLAIGADSDDPASFNGFDGEISEVIIFNEPLGTATRERIESYLSIKYGLGMTAHDFVNSTGTVVYDLNPASIDASYGNHVAGIGRDDNYELNQKQSKSSNGDIVTMGLGTIAASNAANPGTFSANRTFFLWGHDGGGIVETSNEMPNEDGCFERLAREWKAQRSGTLPNDIDVQFDLSDLAGFGSKTLEDFAIMVDEEGDGDFTTGSYKLLKPSSYNSGTGVLSFEGIDFTSTQFISATITFTLLTDAHSAFARLTPTNTSIATELFCTEGNWMHFYDAVNVERKLLSVEVTSGSATVDSIRVVANNLTTNLDKYNGSVEGVALINRLYKIEGNVSGAVTVRVYIDSLEDVAASARYDALNGNNPPAGKEFGWFKYSGDEYDVVNNLESDGYAGDANALELTNYSYQYEKDENGEWVKFVEFTGITGFSTIGGGYFGGGAALPVELLHFDAELITESDALLSWATATEINNSHFFVEHRTDENDWETIGRVEGAGNSQVEIEYAFVHYNIAAGNNYYRLKQVDFDGSFEYSPVRVLNRNVFADFGLYPNPSEGRIYVTLGSGNGTFTITDAIGHIVREGEIKGETIISDLSMGIYVVEVQVGAEVQRKTLVVTK